MLTAALLVCWAVFFAPERAFAHGKEQHADTGMDAGVVIGSDPSEPRTVAKLPDAIANIGGAFSLINHHGEAVSDKTYRGNHILVFFGYTHCQIMCSLSLKRIGDALALLEEQSATVFDTFNALVVTVDPENDTPDVMKESLRSYHPELTGLTGSDQQLKTMYAAYEQNPQVQPGEFNSHTLVSHSSYFYLMGPDGQLKTLFPPVLSAASMAALLKRHLGS